MMTRVSVLTGVIAAMLALPGAAQAQGVPGGAAHGFHEGRARQVGADHQDVGRGGELRTKEWRGVR